MANWQKTNHRFVAFFDIMGFKELVERNSHEFVVGKLQILKETLSYLETMNNDEKLKSYNTEETKSITFSDSIVIFSRSGTTADANKIILDSYWVLKRAIENGIAIKGAISFGEITVDFENSLFFGRPIIDAFLLHEQLMQYSVILDHSCEAMCANFELHERISEFVHSRKAVLKTGRINHKIIGPKNNSDDFTNDLKKLYTTVSGGPRIYIDNTIDFVATLPK